MNSQMDEDKAREALNIKDHEWIITVGDEELAMLKVALAVHAELSASLLKKIEQIG